MNPFRRSGTLPAQKRNAELRLDERPLDREENTIEEETNERDISFARSLPTPSTHTSSAGAGTEHRATDSASKIPSSMLGNPAGTGEKGARPKWSSAEGVASEDPVASLLGVVATLGYLYRTCSLTLIINPFKRQI